MFFLLMIDDGQGGVLHILTMKDGKAVECEYDVASADPYTAENDAAFRYIVAGGGSNYMIYSGKEEGVFYTARNIWHHARLLSRSIKYSINSDGLVKADT